MIHFAFDDGGGADVRCGCLGVWGIGFAPELGIHYRAGGQNQDQPGKQQ